MNMTGTVHGPSPEMVGKMFSMKHDPGWFLQSSVLSFHHTILLRCYGRREFMLDPFTRIPCSLLILTMPLSFSLWSLMQSSLNDSKVFDFSLIMFTEVNLEKSSTTTRTYLLPPMLATCIGLIKSICKNLWGSLMFQPWMRTSEFVYLHDSLHKCFLQWSPT